MRLLAAGVLQKVGEAPLPLLPKGYAAHEIHIAMLNDRKRTEGFLSALRDIIGPDDIVLDIGTGTGVLAVGAALAGAKRVYAVEASGARTLAAAVTAGNGFADRIRIIDGWSTRVTLPERSDVFVSEMIGNEPLAERILEITLDARARLLKPGARHIPQTIEVWILPLCIPPEEMRKREFVREMQQDWNDWYGIDFSALVDSVPPRSAVFYVDPHSVRDWAALTEPALLSQTNLATFTDPAILATATVTVREAGQINGMMTFFESELSTGNTLSSHPLRAGTGNHWLNRVQTLPFPLSVKPGDRLKISYQYKNGSSTASITLLDRDATEPNSSRQLPRCREG